MKDKKVETKANFPFNILAEYAKTENWQGLVNYVGTWFKDFVASQGYPKLAFAYQRASY